MWHIRFRQASAPRPPQACLNPPSNSQGIVNLFKLGIHSRVETGILEHLGNLGGELHIRVEVKFGVQLGIDPGRAPRIASSRSAKVGLIAPS